MGVALSNRGDRHLVEWYRSEAAPMQAARQRYEEFSAHRKMDGRLDTARWWLESQQSYVRSLRATLGCHRWIAAPEAIRIAQEIANGRYRQCMRRPMDFPQYIHNRRLLAICVATEKHAQWWQDYGANAEPSLSLPA